jgi:hypothetical protein
MEEMRNAFKISRSNKSNKISDPQIVGGIQKHFRNKLEKCENFSFKLFKGCFKAHFPAIC